jgi:hypothetical protein
MHFPYTDACVAQVAVECCARRRRGVVEFNCVAVGFMALLDDGGSEGKG